MLDKIDIIIPTLDKSLGERTGALAVICSGIKKEQINVLVIEDTKQEMFTKTVNRGLLLRRKNSLVCILNDDIFQFQLGWLRNLVESLEEQQVICPSGKSHTSPMNKGILGQVGKQIVSFIPFWCILIPGSVLDLVGDLDERFIHYSSDNDWCKRARKLGVKLCWLKEVFLSHKGHGSGRHPKIAQLDSRQYKRKWK